MKPEPLPAQDTELAASLVGVWGLTRHEDYDEKGNQLIDPHLGADGLARGGTLIWATLVLLGIPIRCSRNHWRGFVHVDGFGASRLVPSHEERDNEFQ